MNFLVQFTRGAEYCSLGLPKSVEVSNLMVASKVAKGLLFDARALGEAECPDGYSVYDSKGDWTERYRTVARKRQH
jgi:hypothetical protein